MAGGKLRNRQAGKRQSTFWAVGANVAESIFTGGARRAQVQFAKAGYDASVAAYRDSVLNAFREVQDDVTSLTVLDQANQSQQRAVDEPQKGWTHPSRRPGP